ncbi:MAG: hypothetical protein AB3N14_09090 [Flavobacteriaceae bacterium]
MVKLKRVLRQMALILIICLACAAPFPIIFRRKENKTPIRIEQLDEEEEVIEDLKKLF